MALATASQWPLFIPIHKGFISAPGSVGGIIDSSTSPTSIQPSKPLATRKRELGASGTAGNVTNPTQVEEISTIFVFGFPDDIEVCSIVYRCRSLLTSP